MDVSILVQQRDNLQAAIQYLERGFSVIPIRAAEKGAGVEWKQYQCRRSTREEIEQWFSSNDVNIGIVCGRVSGDLVVFDFDGEKWRDPYNAILEEFPQLSTARIVETGSGKRHLWVRVPGLPEEITKRSLVFEGAKVELIANRHYIVAPPSFHPCGKPYKFINSDEPILEMPWDEFGPIVAWFPMKYDIPDSKEQPDRPSLVDTQKKNVAADFYLQRAINTSLGGNRNETGLWLACQLRDIGLTVEETRPILLEYAQSVPQGDHPYTEEEALVTLYSAYSRPPREPAIARAVPKGVQYTDTVTHTGMSIQNASLNSAIVDALAKFSKTDFGNAESFQEVFGHHFCYVPQKKKWFRWNGNRWAEDNENALLAMEEAARLRHRAAVSLTDVYLRRDLEKWTHASESYHRIKAALSLAQALLKRDFTDFDRDPYLLCCANGVVDLKTGQLRPARAGDMLYFCTNVPFDPTARCSRWEQFLLEIFNGDEEYIKFIQRAVGYTLTADTSEQCMFILFGTGANGKSTFLSVLGGLLGEFAITTPSSTFKDSRGWGSIPNDLARMCGMRLIMATEIRENAPINEEKIKVSTGQDKIPARFLHKEWFDFDPTGKHWWAVNHKPVIRGTDEAIWRRLHFIPFEVSFPEKQQDKSLKKTLLNELPGILNWAIQGSLEWQEMGLDPVDKVTATTATYRRESDVIERFLEECTDRKSGMKAQAGLLYQAYQNWCKVEGENPVSGRVFGDRLGKKGYTKDKKGYVFYEGIGLLVEPDRSGK